MLGNFFLEFPSIKLPIITVTHVRTDKVVICKSDTSRLDAVSQYVLYDHSVAVKLGSPDIVDVG